MIAYCTAPGFPGTKVIDAIMGSVAALVYFLAHDVFSTLGGNAFVDGSGSPTSVSG